MDVNLFDFYLPDELIAQTPLTNRSDSKLLILDKKTGEVTDGRFEQMIDYLHEGDCLVLNDTRVLPARLLGVKEDTGAKVEVLLLKQIEGDKWEVLVKPAKRVKEGTVIQFGDHVLTARCVEALEHGGRVLEFFYTGIFHELLDKLGQMPLPPYIKEQLDDQERY
ncbi:MAG TPA: S-adenosylmethionine:tRNA ribosyltransferase-isomerase, partial [Bacilli bacterium]|nr:S-adenosylmethionine:tRNA ribosyltransferase-isomerase [Bacilli bacterium]